MFDYGKVDEVLKRIIERTDPKKIIVFGSVARREAHDDSDLDLLVLFDDDGFDEARSYSEVKSQFWGILLPSDVFVMPESLFERRATDPYSIEHDIATNGKVVYAQ